MNLSDPVVIAAISAAVLPTVQDAVVAWDASERTKSVMAVLLSAIAGLVMLGLGDADRVTLTALLEAFGFSYAGGYLSFKFQKNVAAGTGKPTPLALGPNIGIGANKQSRYEGD